MAASIKISELNSLSSLTDVDLFLVSDMETGTSRKISYTDLKTSVITETATAVSTLTQTVSQNRADAEALVETIRSALQSSIDSNTSTFTVSDNDLDSRLLVVETDRTTKTYVDTQIAGLRDNAPENLDTLNELAEALGDNPQIITSLQAELTAHKAHMDDINLQLALAYDVPTYIDTLQGG